MAVHSWAETWRRLFFRLGWEYHQQEAITVGATEVELICSSNALKERFILFVFNNSAAIIYCGKTGVSTVNGFPILPNDWFAFETNEKVYAIAAGAGNNVRILEVGSTG